MTKSGAVRPDPPYAPQRVKTHDGVICKLKAARHVQRRRVWAQRAHGPVGTRTSASVDRGTLDLEFDVARRPVYVVTVAGASIGAVCP